MKNNRSHLYLLWVYLKRDSMDFVMSDEFDSLPKDIHKLYEEIIKPRTKDSVMECSLVIGESFFYKEYIKERDRDAATKFIPDNKTATDQ